VSRMFSPLHLEFEIIARLRVVANTIVITNDHSGISNGLFAEYVTRTGIMTPPSPFNGLSHSDLARQMR